MGNIGGAGAGMSSVISGSGGGMGMNSGIYSFYNQSKLGGGVNGTSNNNTFAGMNNNTYVSNWLIITDLILILVKQS